MNPPEEAHVPERTLWTGRRSHWYFLGHWLLGILLPAALGAAIYFYRANLVPWLPWAWAVPALVFLGVIGIITWQRGNRRYTVTSRRVVTEHGRWSKDTQEIRIQDIRSMNVAKSGLTGLLGIGKVEFSSAATDDADVIFYQVGGADGIRDLVRKLQS